MTKTVTAREISLDEIDQRLYLVDALIAVDPWSDEGDGLSASYNAATGQLELGTERSVEVRLPFDASDDQIKAAVKEWEDSLLVF